MDLSNSYAKEHFGVWENVLGFDLTPIVGLAAQRALDGPVITKARCRCALYAGRSCCDRIDIFAAALPDSGRTSIRSQNAWVGSLSSL